MHAAAQWTALSWLFAGGTVVLQPGSLDAAAVWRTIADERVNVVVVVGDAVGRPLIEAYDPSFDTSSLMTISNGGAPMSPGLRERIASTVPNILLVDGFGSSESGAQGSVRMSADEIKASGGKIAYAVLGDDTQVLDESTLQPVVPGSGQQGRVAKTGHVPLRYHNDPEKSAATFPMLDGRRWVLTGDLATVESDGTITLLGRGSQCINTGGEKVFPEEVEGVVKQHPDVWDAVVVGSPDDRWGQAVTAVVSLAPGHDAPSLEALRDFGRAHLAGYKLPRHLVVVDAVERSPAGKADYPWAQQAAAKALAGGGT
jgi:acyl-CoA synthetase (AMP-forming)/AMP-acid ligase II